MAKRFTDTDLFKKKFIRGLQGAYKLLWIYIYHDCNHAGIWEVDFEIAKIKIGFDVTEKKAIELFKGKIKIIDNAEKWFIPSFVEFQYGELKASNKAHNSVIQILKKYKIKGHTSSLQGGKDKDKDKDKVKDKVKELLKETEAIKAYLDWLDWRRREKKKSVTETAMKKQLEALSGLPTADIILIIDHSIQNDYQGLFPDKINSIKQQNSIHNTPQEPDSAWESKCTDSNLLSKARKLWRENGWTYQNRGAGGHWVKEK